MDWEKAKRISIVLLVILNVSVFVLMRADDNRYTLSKSQEKAINEVLARNDITLSAAIPKKYKPVKQLETVYKAVTPDVYLGVFFENATDYKWTGDLSKPVYKLGNAVLTISGGVVVFDNPEGALPNGEFTSANAKKLCDEYINRLKPVVSDFEADIYIVNDDEIRLEYRQRYKGKSLQNNYFIFKCTRDGVIRAELSYTRVVGFTGLYRDICSADEALFCFAKEYRKLYGNAPINISRIELVYYSQESGMKDNDMINMIPCYRIILSDHYPPFLIDAYHVKLL